MYNDSLEQRTGAPIYARRPPRSSALAKEQQRKRQQQRDFCKTFAALARLDELGKKRSGEEIRKNKQQPLFSSMAEKNVRKSSAAALHMKMPPSTAQKIAIAPRAASTTNEWTPLQASRHAQNTVNPIRRVTDCMSVAPNPEKEPIRLNLGDPTLTGCLPPAEAALAAIKQALDSHKYDGYGPAVGIQTARDAIVKHFSTPEAPFTADDVVLASGCSHALELAIVAIADPGQNILVPQPGFPLYSTLCHPNGIEPRHYRLRMDERGLIDLEHLESLIDANTRAIIVNNPSNPTGVVFPKEHLEHILQLAQKHKVPIIADEIYGDLVYGEGARFHPMASLSPRVPMITCDGIGKRYLVPGWRLGWLIVHDRCGGVLNDVRQGIVALSQKIVGPCALVQGALPGILRDTPTSFFQNIKQLLASNATTVYERLSRVPGLRPLRSQGAMYMMVGFDPSLYGDEAHFVRGLIAEESVFCLPGSAFSLPNWFRLVLAFPEETTTEACDRITSYCTWHLRPCIDRLASLESATMSLKRKKKKWESDKANGKKYVEQGSEKSTPFATDDNESSSSNSNNNSDYCISDDNEEEEEEKEARDGERKERRRALVECSREKQLK